MKRNTLKMYNKEGSCLRVETVINNPYEFKVRRKSEKDNKAHWKPMLKGIPYLYAYADKGLEFVIFENNFSNPSQLTKELN